MAAALPMLMCYSIVGETTHEVIGILMFCLFIAHHILNFGWIKTLFKGRYNLRRSMNTTINVIIFVCLIGLMYSGIVISKHIFTFINISGAMLARTLHMLFSYWGFVLMSVHFGMNIRQVISARKLINHIMIPILQIAFGIIAVFGAFQFLSLKFADYMFGRVQFAFIDVTASALPTMMKYLSVMILFSYIGYWLSIAISPKPNKK